MNTDCCAGMFRSSLSGEYIKKLLLSIIKKGSQPNLIDKMRIYIMDNNSLSHTKYNCKYHIVFAPKFRRKEIYGELKKEIGNILRQLCEWKGVTIIEAHACVDHIHIFVGIPPKMSISSFVGYLKGKSSLMIFERLSHLKYKYGNRHFWCRGFYVDTVGRNQMRLLEHLCLLRCKLAICPYRTYEKPPA